MPRIIAGKRRGAKLQTPPSFDLRPTLMRCREALFSSINSIITTWEEESVLDAFAGSGAMGLEAWSRGAKEVFFIESKKEHYQILIKNIKDLKADENSHAILADFPTALQTIKQRFSLVFLDPPYESKLLEKSLLALENSNTLAQNAILALEFDAKIRPIIPHSFEVLKEKNYGRVSTMLLQKSQIFKVVGA